MFLVNFLNRTRTDAMFPVFEIFYLCEIVFLISAILMGIALLVPASRMNYHLNIRLRVICPLVHGIIYPASRIIVMHHQYFGPSYHVEPVYLVVCSQIKHEFLGYFTTLAAVIAIDRWIATVAWAWYERGGFATLMFFFFQEAILTFLSNFVSALLVFDFISDIQICLYFAVVVPLGACVFVLTYRRNKRGMARMKRGAVVNRYSVAKIFQIKENLSVLEMLMNITRPLVLVSFPPMIFYPFYVIVPEGIGYDELRYISVALYDLWLAIACVVTIGSLPVYEPKLRMQIFTCSREEERIISAPSNVEIANTYFDMLSSDLGPRRT